MIPKIIHYCWFGSKPFSSLELTCIESWKKYCPNYQFVLWNESNFSVDFCEFTKEAHRLGKYAFVSDVARVYALNHFGGIYLDTDMLLLQPLDGLLEDEFFIGEHLLNELAVGILGSVSNHPFLIRVLDVYQTAFFDPNRLLLIPIIFDHIRNQVLDKKLKIYSPEIFYPLPFKNKGDNYQPFLKDNTIAVHLWNHAWIDEFMYLKEHKFLKSFFLFTSHLIQYPDTYFRKSFLIRYIRELRLMIKQFIYFKIKSKRGKV